MLCIASGLVIALNMVDAELQGMLWLKLNHYPVKWASENLIPSAFTHCSFSMYPYPCSLRAGTFVALFLMHCFVVFSAASHWGVTITWQQKPAKPRTTEKWLKKRSVSLQI